VKINERASKGSNNRSGSLPSSSHPAHRVIHSHIEDGKIIEPDLLWHVARKGGGETAGSLPSPRRWIARMLGLSAKTAATRSWPTGPGPAPAGRDRNPTRWRRVAFTKFCKASLRTLSGIWEVSQFAKIALHGATMTTRESSGEVPDRD